MIFVPHITFTGVRGEQWVLIGTAMRSTSRTRISLAAGHTACTQTSLSTDIYA